MAVQSVDWGCNEVLRQNRDRLLKDLQRELREYEARYEISSDQLASELEKGRLKDTAEVCEWFIAFESYRALLHGR